MEIQLTYFDFLHQKLLSKDEGLSLMSDFIAQSEHIKDGLMPFPISLRGINWIKFLTKHHITEQTVDDSLHAQYLILIDNIEYHILGNHLLENGFSLLFGAYYFEDETFYQKAKDILTKELKEQILEDGGHFELSPMYHQIILFRVLDSINLIANSRWKNQELLNLLTDRAKIMLGWLNEISYKSGDIPLLNDSANNIAPTTKELNSYATNLNIEPTRVKLLESGYRKIRNSNYELLIDIGNIGPDYIPGHAHSDTFNFELYLDGKPLIVDTGVSTYETNARRMLERATSSHNTVEIDGINQSEVWGGFRVANRAKIVELIENRDYIEATHNGYSSIGALHTRRFTTSARSIMIEDRITGIKKHCAVAYLHCHPTIQPKIKGKTVILGEVTLHIYHANRLEVEVYQYAPQFNKRLNAFKVKITFHDHLKMEIKI